MSSNEKGSDIMIRSDRLLYEIGPDGFGERHCESLDRWKQRAHMTLPNFPDDVLEQWLYRHWKGVMYNWGWLDFRGMVFTKETWSTEDILAKVQTPSQDVIDRLSQRMTNVMFQRSWLVQNMTERGTWPVAPIVLDFERDLYASNGKILKAPFNLLEGHHRLAYLKGLVEQGEYVRDQHELWIAKIPVH
ncbi:TPA: hypothetical protein ACX6QM_002098 [Photobacterium damselae]